MAPVAPEDELRESWRQREYFQALRQAWNLNAAVRYSALFRPELQLTLRNIVFKACHFAVAEIGGKRGQRQQADSLIGELLARPIPNCLTNHEGVELNDSWCKAYRKRMILAHLLCARAAIEANSTDGMPESTLDAVNSEMMQRGVAALPTAFLNDLCGQLTRGERNRQSHLSEVWFPLVSHEANREQAIIAKFVLEPVAGGQGEVFIAVDQAFVPMDADFEQVFRLAPHVLEKQGICSRSSNVSVWIERTVNPGLLDTPLLGNSCGGALALGLRAAWTGEPLKTDLIISFALTSEAITQPDGNCHSISFDSTKLGAVAHLARTAARKLIFLVAAGQGLPWQAAGVEIKCAEDLCEAAKTVSAEIPKTSEAHKKVRLAQELMRDGRAGEAVKEMEQALAMARADGDEEEEVEILVALALTSSERRGRGNRRHYFREAEKKVGKLRSEVAKLIYFRARAAALEEERDLAGAEEAYRTALSCCAGADDDKRNIANQGCIVRSSFVHLLCNQKRIEEARQLVSECEEYARQNKDAEEGELFHAALEAGIHYSLEVGDEDAVIQRITYFEQAAVTSRMANRIGGDLINVANQASHRKAHRAALVAAETSIRLGRRCDDGCSPRFLLGALYTEARVILEAGDDQGALAKAEAILDLCGRPEDAMIRQAALHLIAEVRRLSGDAQSAVDLARRALSTATGRPEEIAFTKSALARALNDNGQTEEAFRQAKEAWVLAQGTRIPTREAIHLLAQIVNYGSQLGESIAAEIAAIEGLPDESAEVKEEKVRALARASANRRLNERLVGIVDVPEPRVTAGTASCSSLSEANAAVVRPLMELCKELPQSAFPGVYDFWGRGNFARILLNARSFPNSFNVTIEVRTLEDVKRAIRLWGLYSELLILLWKGPTNCYFGIVPVPDDYEAPGGWGYNICAGSTLNIEGSTRTWHPALATHSMFPEEVSAFLATEARCFLESGRLVIVPAVSVGCINPGHGPAEQLLASAANALPSIRWKGFAGAPIGLVPYSPDAPLDVLADLVETEAARLRKLRILLLKRTREVTPNDEVGKEAKILSLEIDDALRELADRNEAFGRKHGLSRAKEPLCGATARFRLDGKRLAGDELDSPFAPLFVLQTLGYGWRVDGSAVPKLPTRFEPQQNDVVGTWLSPPSSGWSIPTVFVGDEETPTKATLEAGLLITERLMREQKGNRGGDTEDREEEQA